MSGLSLYLMKRNYNQSVDNEHNNKPSYSWQGDIYGATHHKKCTKCLPMVLRHALCIKITLALINSLISNTRLDSMFQSVATATYRLPSLSSRGTSINVGTAGRSQLSCDEVWNLVWQQVNHGARPRKGLNPFTCLQDRQSDSHKTDEK